MAGDGKARTRGSGSVNGVGSSLQLRVDPPRHPPKDSKVLSSNEVDALQVRYKSMTSSGSVAARTSSNVTPGANSRSTRPSGSTSITQRSVMIR